MHHSLFKITTANKRLIDNPASTTLEPIAIMEGPITAELATSKRVRNSPTAAVTKAHRDPALYVVRAAVFIYTDKDSWQCVYRNKCQKENRLCLILTFFNMNVVTSTALMFRQSREQFTIATHWIGWMVPALISVFTAMILFLFRERQTSTANLNGSINTQSEAWGED